MSDAVSIEQRGRVAVVTIDNPPVNAASHAVRRGIVQAVRDINDNLNADAAVLICAGRTFIAGADIREFGAVVQEPYLPDVVMALEASTKPWVAAIHGTALGGGLEIALGCHYRVADSQAKLGLPEVNLGLIPGAGGTVRLPRCISMKTAIEMITSGKPISTDTAYSHGLINAVSSDDLLGFTIDFAEKAINRPLPQPLSEREIVEPLSGRILNEIQERTKKKAKGQQSPLVALETVQAAAKLPKKEAFAVERGNFHSLLFGDQSEALRHIFFAERTTTKLPELKDANARPITHVGVIGGGTMGAGIAAACLLKGMNVIQIEVNEEASVAGQARVNDILIQSHKRNVISNDRLDEVKDNFAGEIDYSALSEVDLVIEAAFEDIEVKKAIFEKLDASTKAGTILASNTSYLDVNKIAQVVSNPNRVLGLHFFSPAHIMKLVEVIRTETVDDDVLATCIRFAKDLAKIPVLSGVCDGFIGNRVMSAYRREADYLVEDGATPHQVDRAMREFGFPMGIYEMQDLAGLDISWAMRKRKAATRDPAERYVKIADRLCELGRFGRKTGAGWYNYQHEKRYVDDVVAKIIDEERSAKAITPKAFSSDEIMNRILGEMQREGQLVIDEHIARCGDDIDVVMINGYGFPRWRGGPMFMKPKV